MLWVILGVDKLSACILQRFDRFDVVLARSRGKQIVLIWTICAGFFLLETAKLGFSLVDKGRAFFICGLRLSEPLGIDTI